MPNKNEIEQYRGNQKWKKDAIYTVKGKNTKLHSRKLRKFNNTLTHLRDMQGWKHAKAEKDGKRREDLRNTIQKEKSQREE
jgi:hypothetical protein